MKKISIVILVVLIGLLLCSCRIYFSKEDVGRYYCYENNERSDTWIEFKNDQVGWADSDGNHGYVRGSGDLHFLYKSSNLPSNQKDMVYMGFLRQGTFSFKKINDAEEENEYYREFYSDKSSLEYKDSAPVPLYSVVYSVTPSEKNIYSYYAVQGIFRERGCDVYSDEQCSVRTEDDRAYISFSIKDSEENRTLARGIATEDPDASVLIKDSKGKAILTAKDLQVQLIDDNTIKFVSGKAIAKTLLSFFIRKPSEQLELYILGEYVRDVPINASTRDMESFELTRDDAYFIAKYISFAHNGIQLTLVE